MPPLISVVIPCYNSSHTIRTALKSVLDQTCQDFEVLLVDDFSTDTEQLKEILNTIADHRIRYFRHEKNRNGAAARNTGIQNAQGRYMAFLDADDEWLPEHLERSMNALEAVKKDRCLVYCKSLIKTANNADAVLPERGIGAEEDLGEYLFRNEGYISTPSIFSYTALFRDFLFDEKLIRHQDYELLLRMNARGCSFLFSDHVGVVVHWEGNDVVKKGGTIAYSVDFAHTYKDLFSPKAYTYFVLRNVVFKLLEQKKRFQGLGMLVKECSFFRIRLKDWIFLWDYFIFGKLTIVKWLVSFKK